MSNGSHAVGTTVAKFRVGAMIAGALGAVWGVRLPRRSPDDTGSVSSRLTLSYRSFFKRLRRVPPIPVVLALGLAYMLAVILMETVLAAGATFTVSNTNDGGPGSLRQAIEQANANGNPNDIDTIQFNIPGSGVKTISPASTLPPITQPVTIDGYTQPGASENTLREGTNANLLIELKGPAPPTTPLPYGLLIDNAANSTVSGLVISGFANGVTIQGGSASGNKVQGNYIGTDATGTADRGNFELGVRILGGAANNTIGGTDADDGTVDGLVAARNLISGNDGHGVGITDAKENRVQGNYIGANAAGTARLGNSSAGVVIHQAFGNFVGGTGAGNVISGNYGNGVWILDGAAANTVQGNYIGADANGSAALGNFRYGVEISGASNNTIGGSDAGAANVIAFNGDLSGEDGVNIRGFGFAPATGNAILSNSIFSNVGLGIDLEPNDGVTPNDPNDADTGPDFPNNLQNFPQIQSVADAGGSTTVTGTLNSTPDGDFTVEVFRNDAAVGPDPSGNGEGQTFVGRTVVHTDPATGDANFAVTGGSAGSTYTATARDQFTNDTSEFGPAFVTTPTNAAPEAVDDTATTDEDAATSPIDVLSNDTGSQ